MSYQPRILNEEVIVKLMENQLAMEDVTLINASCTTRLFEMLSTVLSEHLPMAGQQFKSFINSSLALMISNHIENIEVFKGNGKRGKRIQELILENKIINNHNRPMPKDGLVCTQHPIEIDYENMFIHNPIQMTVDDYNRLRFIDFFINALIIFNGIDNIYHENSASKLPILSYLHIVEHNGFYLLKDQSLPYDSTIKVLHLLNTHKGIKYNLYIQLNELIYLPFHKVFYTHEYEKVKVENTCRFGNFIFDGLISNIEQTFLSFIEDKIIVNDVDIVETATDIIDNYIKYIDHHALFNTEKYRFYLADTLFRFTYMFSQYIHLELSFKIDPKTKSIDGIWFTMKDTDFIKIGNNFYDLLMKSMLNFAKTKLMEKIDSIVPDDQLTDS